MNAAATVQSRRTLASQHSLHLDDIADRAVAMLKSRPIALSSRELLARLRVRNIRPMSLSFVLVRDRRVVAVNAEARGRVAMWAHRSHALTVKRYAGRREAVQ